MSPCGLARAFWLHQEWAGDGGDFQNIKWSDTGRGPSAQRPAAHSTRGLTVLPLLSNVCHPSGFRRTEERPPSTPTCIAPAGLSAWVLRPAFLLPLPAPQLPPGSNCPSWPCPPQRNSVTCLRSYSWSVAEAEFEPGSRRPRGSALLLRRGTASVDTGEGQARACEAVSKGQTEHVAGDKTRSKARPALSSLGSASSSLPLRGAPGAVRGQGLKPGQGSSPKWLWSCITW